MRLGGPASDALWESVKLAQIAEELGYKRYWVAEHHNSGSYTGTAPELLIGQIAARTESIRVGSGGIMLPHYSALKVAEQFRILEALSYPRPQMDVRHFPQQVTDLLGFLSGNMDNEHPLSKIQAQPGPSPSSIPELWMLGSSD